MTTLTDKDQVYTLTNTVPYTRRDGTSTDLCTWTANCTFPGCTATYDVVTPRGFTPATSKAFGCRRCHLHKMTRQEITANWQAAIRENRARKKLQASTSPTT